MCLKSKQGHNKKNITATRWTKNAFILFNTEIVYHKIKNLKQNIHITLT